MRPTYCPTHKRYEQLCPCFPYSELGIPFENPPAPDFEKSRREADQLYAMLSDKRIEYPLIPIPVDVPAPVVKRKRKGGVAL